MKQGWEIKKLGEVASIKSGKSIDASQISTNASLYPCYGGNGVRGFVNDYSYDGCFPIIGRVGALCGNVHLAKGKFYATEHALVVEIKSTNIDSEWLKYNLISLNLRNIAKGVAQPVIAAGEVSKIPIPVPPLPEQEKIVSELDCLSGIIEKKRQQLKELDALAQSIFYEMFGNPVDNERGWEVKALKDIADFYNGVAHEGAVSEDGKYDIVNSKFISTQGEVRKHCEQQMFPLIKNDIVMVMSDVPNGKALAKCYLIETDDKYTLNQRICAFRNYNLVPIYLYYYLNRHPYYLDFDNGNGQTNLRKNEVLNCPIFLPPLPLQQSFAQKIEAVEQQKALIKQSIAEVETLFNSRMDFYFN